MKTQSVLYSSTWTRIIAFLLFFLTILSSLFVLFVNDTYQKGANASDPFNKIPVNVLNSFNPTDLCVTNDIACQSTEREYFQTENLIDKPIQTNKIYSSGVFYGNIEGLHLFPNIARSDEVDGVNVGFGERYEGSNWVSHTLNDSYINVSGDNVARTALLSKNSALTSTFSFVNESRESQFEATFVQGSPYIYFNPKNDILKFKANNFDITNFNGRTILKQNNSETRYVLFNSGIASIDGNEITIDFSLSPVKYATLAYLNDDSQVYELEKYGSNIVDTVDVDMISSDTEFGTRYKFSFKDFSPSSSTLFGLLPHQWNNSETDYETIYQTNTLRGDQKFTKVSGEFDFNIKKEIILENTPFDLLSQDDVNRIKNHIVDEIPLLTPWEGGSYYGGKNLSKAARMAEIADDLGMVQERDEILEKIKFEMEKWFSLDLGDPNYRKLKYDEVIKSIFADPEEFSSEVEINDHHFHYGMLIYSASVVGKYDDSFRQSVSPIINVLIRDIANPDEADDSFSYMRSFDFFESHSWASGNGVNRDGNNQESSSEAIFAWYAIWRWGRVIENSALSDMGHYLYTNEINSTNHYWLGKLNDDGEDNTPFKDNFNYQYKTASLIFGGSYKFDTWFSQDPLAIKGIQYLPFTAGASYFKDDQNINREYDIVSQYTDFQTRIESWADLNLMYYATSKGKGVRSDFMNQYNNIWLDNGNSKSNFFSWVAFWDGISDYTKLPGKDYSLVEFTFNGEQYSLVDCDYANAFADCLKGTQIIKNNELIFGGEIDNDNVNISKSNVDVAIPDFETVSKNEIDDFISNNLDCSLTQHRDARYYSCYIKIQDRIIEAVGSDEFRIRVSSDGRYSTDCNVTEGFILCLFLENSEAKNKFSFEYRIGQSEWRKTYKKF